MDKYQKWGLAVAAFVTTAMCARSVGQFEMKAQAEKQIAVLQERNEKLTKQSMLWFHYYIAETHLSRNMADVMVSRCRRNDDVSCGIVEKYTQLMDDAELEK